MFGQILTKGLIIRAASLHHQQVTVTTITVRLTKKGMGQYSGAQPMIQIILSNSGVEVSVLPLLLLVESVAIKRVVIP